MKYLLILVLFTTSCAIRPKEQYQYYWYSHTSYQDTQQSIDSGTRPTLNHTTVDGVEFTCCCAPKFVEDHYKRNFPDVVLVKKLPKGRGKVLIHY